MTKQQAASPSFQATRLAGNHVVISWVHASAHCVQLYREVGANGPTDKGAIIATRELPVTATAEEVQAVEAELTELHFGRVV
jgi:hypothetical protein